jgi:secreted PhoX family phosphatase
VERLRVNGPVSRRAFLGAGVATGLGVVVAGTLGTVFNGRESGTAAVSGGVRNSARAAGYGALVSDPEGRLALPEGFRYRLLAEEGVTRLESGEPSPSDPDAAAAFHSDTSTVLVCNHEVGSEEPHPVPHAEGLVYDPAGRGGTTTIEMAPDGTVVRQYVSLAGTHKNCAGGRTPWDTWLSCEETEKVMDKPHGYVFEVDPFDRDANRDPKPIKALGRFPHEAVVVDPDSFVMYETEDARNPNGGFYRWTPPAEALPLGKGSLRALADDAGTLEALKATTSDGRHVADLSEATAVGTTYKVSWVEVVDRDAADKSVRRQFADDQVTRGRKLEGMWWGDGGAYFVSSFARAEDGEATTHDGQVWFLDPAAGTIKLHLRFAAAEKPDEDPNAPDNITVSPFGGVMIAEDGEGHPNLLGATPEGQVFVFAQSEPEIEGGEFCGPVFSDDRRTLFVNLQGPGLTFAVQGPFAEQS